MSRLARLLADVGLADVLVVGGGIAAVTGVVQLAGWAVTLAVFGSLALVCGVGLVIRETRRGGR